MHAAPETDPQLVFAGEGSARSSLEAVVRACGLGNRVHMIGFRADLEVDLEALDIAVLSSDREGMPLFAYECMAHGTPLVATDVGGLSEIAADGAPIVLVPRRDPEALSRALGSLLGDRARREALSVAAAEWVSEFTIERVAEQFADLYDRLLSREGIPAR